MVLLVSLIFIAICHYGRAIAVCEPYVTFTSSLDSCYNIRDIIEVTYVSTCLPLNTPLTVSVCKVNGNKCTEIGEVSSNGKTIHIKIIDVCELGLSYYIVLSNNCYGIGVTSSVFEVNEATISITDVTNWSKKDCSDSTSCFELKDIVQITLSAKCFDPETLLSVYACSVETGDCELVSLISSDDTCVLILLKDPFIIETEYYIKIKYQDSYLEIEDVTGNFLVSSSCKCSPSLTITSPLENCYKYGETITITYVADCLPINDVLNIFVCNSNKNCYELEPVRSSGKSFDINLVSPVIEKKGTYVVKIITKDGSAKVISTPFEIGKPYIRLTS
ncbi:hypothetical protein ACFFRR_003344 [Megaselia abdita]